MTLAAIHHDAIKACLAIPGNMEKLCEGLDRKNLNNGLIQPQKTIRAYVPDQVGEENANQGERVMVSNARNNAFWGPIMNPI